MLPVVALSCGPTVVVLELRLQVSVDQGWQTASTEVSTAGKTATVSNQRRQSLRFSALRKLTIGTTSSYLGIYADHHPRISEYEWMVPQLQTLEIDQKEQSLLEILASSE